MPPRQGGRRAWRQDSRPGGSALRGRPDRGGLPTRGRGRLGRPHRYAEPVRAQAVPAPPEGGGGEGTGGLATRSPAARPWPHSPALHGSL